VPVLQLLQPAAAEAEAGVLVLLIVQLIAEWAHLQGQISALRSL
jgi:hypothetical protein